MSKIANSLLLHATAAPNLGVFARLIATRIFHGIEVLAVSIWHLRDDGDLENIACYHNSETNAAEKSYPNSDLRSQLRSTISRGEVSRLPLPSGILADVSPANEKLSQIQIPLHGGGPYFGVLHIVFSDTVGNPAETSWTDEVVESLRLATEGVYWRTCFGNSPFSPPRQGGAQAKHSPRQLRILSLIAEGLTMRQIGTSLNVSESTVKQEALKIYRNLGVSSRNEAIDAARKSGISFDGPEQTSPIISD